MLGLAVVAGGCAANQAEPSRVAGPVRDMPSGEPRSVRVEIEEDGLPAQIAPQHRVAGPDDPTQPWSPNYGSLPPAQAEHSLDTNRLAAKLDVGRQANPLSPSARPMNADDVIRQAIAAHEMRRN
jgi:hypothetical protein